MSWPTVPLEQCTQIISGATPKTAVPAYWGGEIAWATPADLSELDGKYLDNTPRTITEAGLTSCAATILPPGSVLFSSRAPIGHVAINRVPVATNQGFKSFIPKERLVEAGYLYWWLRSNRSYLESLGNGATFKELSKSAIARVAIPLPPLPEQRYIATILDQADELRRKRRAATDHLNILSPAIFQEMFSRSLASKSNWPTAQLAQIVQQGDQINYGVVQPGDGCHNGVPLIRVANLVSNNFSFESLKKIDPKIEAQYKRSRLRGDEILIACVGSIGAIALATADLAEANIARAVARIRVDPKKTNRVFVAEFLRSDVAQRYFYSETRTVAQPTLNIKQLSETPIYIPPLELQISLHNAFRRLNA